MTDQIEDKERFKRQRKEQAIRLASESRWDEAVAVNQSIVSVLGDATEADTYNRLGKALSEVGKIKEARDAYQSALDKDPANNIARRNLERLSAIKGKTADPDKAQQVDASLFIEESGKTGMTTLRPSSMKMLATLSAGDEVNIAPVGPRLTVETAAGEYISDIEPKLALRLSKLMAGGNKYAAAVAAVEPEAVRVIIKETFQDPSLVGRVSFPAGKAGDLVRPYTKETMVRADLDDDEEYAEDTDDWEEPEAETEGEEPREVSLFDAVSHDDGDDEEFEE